MQNDQRLSGALNAIVEVHALNSNRPGAAGRPVYEWAHSCMKICPAEARSNSLLASRVIEQEKERKSETVLILVAV